MGLDISLCSNKFNDYTGSKNFTLSREFCSLMCRQHVVDHEPELNQIGKITGVDISCFYKMEKYPNEEEIQMRVAYIEDENEKKRMVDEAKKKRKLLEGNLNDVFETLNNLMERLKLIEDLPVQLRTTNRGRLNFDYYFSDFNTDKGDGYINNNFGQDLRNFKRFLQKAHENNSDTVWFYYA